MEKIETTYSDEEKAWMSSEIFLHRDIYLLVTLTTPGKIVIRQDSGDGKKPKIPIKRHKNTSQFALRIKVVPDIVKIQIFTSTEPKEIKYAYI